MTIVVDVLLFVGVAPQPPDPLHAVGVEPEEVLGRRAQGGVLCGRSAVDEGDLGRALGEIADRDALDPGQGADDDAGALLDQQARLCDDGFRGSVRGLDHGLDGPLAIALLVLLQGQLVAAQGIPPERLERAFERGKHADFQGLGVGIRLNSDEERHADQDDPRHAA